MALLDKMQAIQSQTEALLGYANGVTGAADTRLGDAVKTLADGYWQGGGLVQGTVVPETNTGVLNIPEIIGKSNVLIIMEYAGFAAVGVRQQVALLFLDGMGKMSMSSNSADTGYISSCDFSANSDQGFFTLNSTTGVIQRGSGPSVNYKGEFIGGRNYHYFAW